jgi:hypothetical protein
MRLLADMGRRVAADMGLLSAEPGLREGFALGGRRLVVFCPCFLLRGGQPKVRARQVEPGEQEHAC